MSYARRFILIDSNSGFVWGEATAATPTAAAEQIDTALGETGRVYTEHGPRVRVDESHYLAYEAPAAFPAVDDGQHASTIAGILGLPLVARIEWHA